MKKILIVPVNYNSYDKLNQFIESCEEAYKASGLKFDLTVKIADNSTAAEREVICLPSNSFIKYESFKYDNLGYLGAFAEIVNSTFNIELYDFVILTNVDLELDNQFFSNLLQYESDPNIGWIAPQLYSKKEDRDKNPKIIRRYSLKRLKLLGLLYKYPLLHKLYEMTLYRRKKMRVKHKPQRIYAGHGSMMIFDGKALTKLLPIHYPVFLFGEELFFAEMFRRVGFGVYYYPNIRVLDHEHTSTGSMKSNFYYKCNKEAISYIISEFYE